MATSCNTSIVRDRIAGTVSHRNDNANIATMIVPLLEVSEHKVVHNYHDHANDPDGDYDSHPNVGVEQTFPMKLHYCLNEIELDGLSHIVSWQPHGRCFMVHNQDLFVKRILGCWFRQSKIASFQRQLNIYGFQRLTTGPDKGAYYHELFLRSKPGLASKIQRHKLKGTKTRKAANPESEPNFYALAPMPMNKKPYSAASPDPLMAAVPRACTVVGTMGSPGSPECRRTPDASLTLQKMVAALFSPSTFESTLRHPMPQFQQQNSVLARDGCGGGHTMTSAFSAISKPMLHMDASSGSGGFSAIPLSTMGWPSPSVTRNSVESRIAANNDSLWAAALRDARAGIPMTLHSVGNSSNNASISGTPSSIWLLR